MDQEKLGECRMRIDELDERIVGLLSERAKIAQIIGALKAREHADVFVPKREREVYDRIRKLNPGPLSDECLMAIWRELMSGTIALERPIRVSYLGPGGTFSHEAAKLKFGESVEYLPVGSIQAIFSDVNEKVADYGVVPVENSTGGAVSDTLDMFIEYDVKIMSEVLLDVKQNLLSSSALSKIRRVYSKQQVFEQCRSWLYNNLPHAELVDCRSTAGAAEIAAGEDDAAAIGSKEASNIYNLPIVAQNIADRKKNLTRFFVIGGKWAGKTGNDKTSLMILIRDEVGALYDLLLPFKHHGINLTRIESRPSRLKAWDYYFFIDLFGHVEDEGVKAALLEIERTSRHTRILGSYPKCNEDVT